MELELKRFVLHIKDLVTFILNSIGSELKKWESKLVNPLQRMEVKNSLYTLGENIQK